MAVGGANARTAGYFIPIIIIYVLNFSFGGHACGHDGGIACHLLPLKATSLITALNSETSCSSYIYLRDVTFVATRKMIDFV